MRSEGRDWRQSIEKPRETDDSYAPNATKSLCELVPATKSQLHLCFTLPRSPSHRSLPEDWPARPAVHASTTAQSPAPLKSTAAAEAFGDDGACPTPAWLEAFVAGTDVGGTTSVPLAAEQLAQMSSQLTTHLAGCAACRARVAELRSDRSLASECREAFSIASDPPTDTRSRIDNFTILDEIGAGGQGTVFRARDARTGREVALKLLHVGRVAPSRQRKRMDREMEIVARLRHPGIVTLHEAIELPTDGLGLVMELINGIPLDHWAVEQRSKARSGTGSGATAEFRRRLFEVLRGVCDAVHYAHLHGVVHRDIKPSNVLIDANDRPHVVDFGIARTCDDDTVTLGSEIVGSPPYMAPEQARGGEDAVDLRSDLFAIGAMGYELLTGQLALPNRGRGDRLAATIEKEHNPPSPSSVLKLARPRDVDAVFATALARDPERRYQSARDLGADFSALIDGGAVLARRDSLAFHVRSIARRHRRRLIATGAVAAALLAVAGTYGATSWSARQRESALRQVNDVWLRLATEWRPSVEFSGQAASLEHRFTPETLASIADAMDAAIALETAPASETHRLRLAVVRACLISDRLLDRAEVIVDEALAAATEGDDANDRDHWLAAASLYAVRINRNVVDAAIDLHLVADDLLANPSLEAALRDDIEASLNRLEEYEDSKHARDEMGAAMKRMEDGTPGESAASVILRQRQQLKESMAKDQAGP